ncbi:hypothetical protein H2198_000951 [Neophaeococcomyces mojaviensis]|uniref:Uncharacterized protein n=1 Tax=Neophaeococcomyces mojaviensis TaxID=3383035 RepID=A0ACC3AJ03_9EURO|nr:hypothetical protein H2198_000951 [Knufia sp. JES_112]
MPQTKQAFDVVHLEDPSDSGVQAVKGAKNTLTEPLDAAAEARLRRKIDLYTVPTVAILYLCCFIDRTNIGNARLAGFEKDLKLKGYDYNIVLSIFYVSYILFEIPSNMACKLIGPGWYLPTLAVGFGIATVGFAFVRDIGAACGVRFLLGALEAGILPGVAYYMSRWYRRSELVFRLCLYIVMGPLAGAFGGLLASAILSLDHFGSTKRWEMIFAIEGIITIGLALISFFTLTDRPETANWLTAEEKQLAVNRVLSERVGSTELLDKVDSRKTLRGIFNPVVLSTAMVLLLINITVQGLAFFLPTIVRAIYPHKTLVQQQLLTVPPYIFGSVFVLCLCYTSWRMDRRNIFMTIGATVVIPGYIIFLATSNSTARYAATFIVAAGSFSFGALTQAQSSANVVSDTARSAAIGTTVMLGNVGGLVSTWSFLPFDGPNYRIGNGLNLAANATIFILTIFLGIWMRADNRKRESKEQIAQSSLEQYDNKQIQDLDWKHPSFRWRS